MLGATLNGQDFFLVKQTDQQLRGVPIRNAMSYRMAADTAINGTKN
jgi:hypothetical protein